MAYAASEPDEILCTTAGKENFQRLTRLLICGGTSLLDSTQSYIPTKVIIDLFSVKTIAQK